MGLGTIYTWSLYNQPLVDKFHWPLSSVATTFSLTSFFLAFATLFAGRIQERIGIRQLTLIAGVVLGLSLMAASGVSSLPMLWLLVGVVVGLADGAAYITTLSNLMKWFPHRKGVIAGISVGAYGSGSLLFKYINSALLVQVGVSQTFFWWGVMALLMITGGAMLLKEAPVQPAQTVAQGSNTTFTVSEMLRRKEAWLLFVVFFTACMSGLYLIGIVKDIGVKMAGLDAMTAASAVSAIAICNTAGRLILGYLSDKIGRLRVLNFTLLVTALAVTVMAFLPLNAVTFFLCTGAIAFCFGGNITVYPAIVADFFGLKHHSKNYGLIYQGFGLGPLVGSLIAAALGGFHSTFIAIALLSVVSLVITLFIQPPRASRAPDVALVAQGSHA
ncbi:Oxalate/formate antiporter. Putative antiporter, pyruvate-inducible; inner membrane protein [Dickeya aquatica]|uniref:Oxalate/formate antiporter. Putative antiporter, pyruvate-inducible inner membrane protein n=2 Tax=Pectobacteriaceae TaxID=1903410 RepID=A0A375AAH1_9GAMM|nr:Oxalate/formate antiporter. Putative antiporter, pyruvate-inducible; inner membrane protein [Dickeya aquatica]